jgi:signal transduction histidine kinase/ActR/RegA family two-component response regulator
MPMSDADKTDHLAWLPRSIALLAAITGLLECYGWIYGIVWLRAFPPGFPGVTFNSAVAFILCGVSLGLANSRHQNLIVLARACALLAAAVGFLTLCEYIFGWDVHIDQLLFAVRSSAALHPGRMSIISAISFTLLGVALFNLGRPNRDLWQWPALVTAAIAFVILLGYAYQVSSPANPRLGGRVPLNSTILYFLLGLGALLAGPDRGILARIMEPGAAGLLIRRFLPVTLLLIPLLGWLRLQGELAGFYGLNTGLALFVTANVAIFMILIWVTAADIRRAELARSAAERKSQDQLARLSQLNHITVAMGERQDLASIFQAVVRNLEDNLPADFASIFLYEPAGHALSVSNIGAASYPVAKALGIVERTKLPVEKSGLASCLDGKLIYEPDIRGASSPFLQRMAEAGFRAFVSSPLMADGAVLGLLAVARRNANSFTSPDCEFLRQLGDNVALAARQARLHETLQQSYDDLRRTREGMMQQERLRALGQMASGIAHDINNAISPVSLYTQSLLENEAGLGANIHNYLETVKRVINDISATVGRMREFYRERDPNAERAPVDLNEMVQQVVELTRARWSDVPQRNGIVISVDTVLGPTLPPVLGIEHEIREALTNLIFNAVDALPEGGSITIRTRADGEADDCRIRLEVGDTGVGMDEETRRRCLEPFFTTKGERGTGLGLAMVLGMAQRHEAAIEMETGEGRGTTVKLTFPAARDALPQPAVARDQAPAPMRLLLIDDDPFVLDSMRIVLAQDGHDIVDASGGDDGIGAFEKAVRESLPFDLVITDLGMPHTDGNQVIRAVKRLSPHTPVLLLTGWGRRMDAGADASVQPDFVLGKPPQLEELREIFLRCQNRADQFQH